MSLIVLGGYYVTARLVFDEEGLARAKLGFGHTAVVPGISE